MFVIHTLQTQPLQGPREQAILAALTEAQGAQRILILKAKTAWRALRLGEINTKPSKVRRAHQYAIMTSDGALGAPYKTWREKHRDTKSLAGSRRS